MPRGGSKTTVLVDLFDDLACSQWRTRINKPKLLFTWGGTVSVINQLGCMNLGLILNGNNTEGLMVMQQSTNQLICVLARLDSNEIYQTMMEINRV